MSLFTLIKKHEVIFTKHELNWYEGPLTQRVIDITHDLKLLIDISQVPVFIYNQFLQPQIAFIYKVFVREIKNGIIRPYLGDEVNNILRDRYVSPMSNINYAIIPLTNVWVYSEPTIYEVTLCVEIAEPLGSTFPATIVLLF